MVERPRRTPEKPHLDAVKSFTDVLDDKFDSTLTVELNPDGEDDVAIPGYGSRFVAATPSSLATNEHFGPKARYIVSGDEQQGFGITVKPTNIFDRRHHKFSIGWDKKKLVIVHGPATRHASTLTGFSVETDEATVADDPLATLAEFTDIFSKLPPKKQ